MTREVVIQDVMALVVPDYADPANPVSRAFLVPTLDILARKVVARQYEHRKVQPELRMESINWLLTRDPEDVEKFQPAHDCVACRAGNDQALAQLKAHPEKWIALANITYTEVWP